MYYHIQVVHVNCQDVQSNDLEKLNVLGNVSRMVANLRTSPRILTEVAIDDFIQESEDHTQSVIEGSRTLMQSFIDRHKSITAENLGAFTELLQANSFSKYLRSEGHLRAVKENFTFIEPLTIPLGKKPERKRDKKSGKYPFAAVYDTFQYVPILDTIKCVLNNDKIREFIHNEPITEDRFLKGFQDGSIFKENELFKKYPHALRIQIYFDEIVVIH